MAKRNLDTTGSDNNKAPERRRRTTGDTSGKTAAGQKPRGRRKTDLPANASVVAATETSPASFESPAPVTAEGAIEAVTTATRASNGARVTAGTGNGHGPDVRISHDDIALRAYHLYLERGGQPGDQLQDWITAERQLRERSLEQ